MISFDQAQKIIDETLKGYSVPAETIPVLNSYNRILAEAAVSRLDLPPFDKSLMDGYAIMPDDIHESYRVIEHIPAGKVPTQELQPGTAAKVMTGAPVPKGTGYVVMVEDTDRGNDIVHINYSVHGNQDTYIGKQGSDIRAGQELLAPGFRLNALRIANLVSCGISEVCVRSKIRIGIITTGDEIVDHFEKIAPGKIMDSNGPMLQGLADECGLDVVFRKNIPDNCNQLTAAIHEAISQVDILLFSGGVSAGDFDFVPSALINAGFTIHFDRIAIKPGKPLTFATNGNCVAFGLPGNPVSVFTGFHFFVRRALNHLNKTPIEDRSFPLPLQQEFSQKNADRLTFLPAKINSAGYAERISYHGSAHLLALSQADGFIQIPLGTEKISAGEPALFFPFL